jgi:regulator of cell morphogenesis and NO signaling
VNGPPDAARAAALAAPLVAHIVERFHEAHRRDLPVLKAVVRALPASPQTAALADRLDDFALALERHMFKEEMRLFPMMEQGGNPLVGELIDDMAREHVLHGTLLAQLKALHRALPPLPAAERARLDSAFGGFLADLAAHVEAEESRLFPLFAGSPRQDGARVAKIPPLFEVVRFDTKVTH